ncbi:MAG: hypothetical protein ACK5LN_00145 [Propioniciclava sp.]
MALTLIVLLSLFGGATAEMIAIVGTNMESLNQNDPNHLALNNYIGLLTVAAVVVAVLGTGGWVASIVAIARKAGRAWGIAGCIVGALAPLAGFVAMTVAMGPGIS